jgi:NAD(P)-dependent dehydrogenase (short-subunit alcohol dehydrogenase family)
MRRFEGKVALVTGGSSGIGRATALVFAREGARVVLAAHGAERGEGVAREIREAGGEALFVATDVSRADPVARLVRHTVERFGRLDCAFNNAATLEVGMFRPTADYSEEEFDQALALNLKSVWPCMKEELAQMLRQGGGGAIVNTSSVNGLGGVRSGALYAAAGRTYNVGEEALPEGEWVRRIGEAARWRGEVTLAEGLARSVAWERAQRG